MALFFDSAWFDRRLTSLGLSRADLGSALGLSEGELAEVWKDQRELKGRDVRIMAALLGCSPTDIAEHAGISTPVPKDDAATTNTVLQRLDQIDKTLSDLKGLVQSIDRFIRRET